MLRLSGEVILSSAPPNLFFLLVFLVFPGNLVSYITEYADMHWPNMQAADRPHNSAPVRSPPLSGSATMSTASSVRLATSLLRIATSVFFLISFHVLLSGWGANGVTLQVVNRCPFVIWPAVAPNGGNEILAYGGFFLPPGQSRRFRAPSTWSGRLWARTDCDFGSPWRGQPCLTGDCQGGLACNGSTGQPPATLVQMTLQPGGRAVYDVSVVDGYNLPVSVSASPFEGGCLIGGCVEDLNMVCPPELQVRDRGKGVVACRSACLAFDLDEYCCRNDYGSADTCMPSSYSRAFRAACPGYCSYAFDRRRPPVSCSSQAYIITFCPPVWPCWAQGCRSRETETQGA